MAIWIPLLVAPFLALMDQSIALSMTTWACRGQHGIALHVVHAVFALAAALTTWLAWLGWRETVADAEATEGAARRRFLAAMAIGSAALSLLVTIAIWVPTWLLSSCLQ